MKRIIMQSHEFYYLDEVWNIKWYLVTTWYEDNTSIEHCEPVYDSTYVGKYEV